MSDIDDILKKVKESLGEMADEAQEKYNDLKEYLDSHSGDEIKEDLRKIAEKVADEAREGVEDAKEEIGKIDIDEKMSQAREGVAKAKEYVDSGLETIGKQWEELLKRINK